MAKALDVILHAGGRGRDLVKALTDFARKGLGETTAFDLNEVVRKEVELLRQTTLKRINVTMDLDPQLPLIRGVASDLGSSIMNLSVNAVDAMPDGGTLTFRSKALPEGWVELTVSDTGQGMPPEVRSRAMEPFFTTKPVGKGTGLGLSRVYGTVRSHGGTLNLWSEPGQGTSVILRLPTGQEPEAKPPERRPAEVERPAVSLRVLLVDDEGIILETVPALLDALGHRVETASLGELALQRLQTDPDFDLVILDHNMPGMTGAETLIHLRRLCPSLPVILSTGYMDAGTEDLLSRVPRVWTLKKPYSTKDLQRVLAEIAEAVPR
jgi:CheY-like chemotaxis protein